MAKPMSAHNPFRTPNLTPMPTGASTASSSANPFNSPPHSPPSKNTPLAQPPPPHTSFAPEFEPIVERETDSPSPPASPAPPPPPQSPSPPPPEPVPPEITINNTGSTTLYAPPPGSPPRTHSPSPYLSQLDPPPPSGSRGPSSSPSHFAPPSGPPPSDTHSNLPPNLDEGGSGGLDEELPPAYSAAPDPSIGETTVELGPRRPFQRAPELPGQGVGWQPQIQPRRTPQPQSHSQRLAHQPTGSLSSSGRIAPPSHPLRSDSNIPLALLNSSSSSSAAGGGRSNNNSLAPPTLPARQRSHSAGAGSRPTRPPISPPEGELSEFAREFYAAGGRIPGSEPEVEGEGGAGDENAERRGRTGAGTGGGGGEGADIGRSRTQYLPPPGEPPLPRRPTSAGGGRSGSGSGSTRGGAGGSGGVADDGKPTRQPVPGHPLLNAGNILVYPAGYECRKCHNIGYKAADPNNPCRKCWDKFGKPFTNAMNYIPWSPARDAQAWSTNSSSGKSFQRPLPSSRAPHLSVSTSNLSSGGSSSPRPSASTSSTYLGSSTVSSIPVNENAHRRAISNPVSQHGSYNSRTRPAQPLVQLPSSLSPPPLNRATSGALRPRLVAAGARPPPGAVVYQPGDPRLGGSLCWRCDGRGVTTFFIFDEGRCEACNGLGRIF
ncbi:uncharacterized protein STEHIDRAFT_173171 [Stereum hirsutum FP-91666 SS1]|uniref:Uncharacterized protein n=1 Tax=Stereum hirsutum (strain FP-91666) TaxID=721885 RepID=R7RY74_STEHR|nr:uncharacterized protein STEHIDRAFT_173171 [Stereum hirsutum FP-91666 SS1]EIM79302.1 hypothetical protein STEHIDRAFT_173171 [Stereum hirsutum FP-91666 SS1]